MTDNSNVVHLTDRLDAVAIETLDDPDVVFIVHHDFCALAVRQHHQGKPTLVVRGMGRKPWPDLRSLRRASHILAARWRSRGVGDPCGGFGLSGGTSRGFALCVKRRSA